MHLRRICVFCGSNSGRQQIYARAAAELGQLLAQQKIGVVYGGGNIGLMGALADATLAAKGEVIGVIPHALVAREVAHNGLTDLRVVGSMHERKALMADLSDGFIALPGGYGTVEEFMEVVTWSQLGIHKKPCGLLNSHGYYDALIAMLDHAVREGFLYPKNRALIIEERDAALMIDALREFRPVATTEWISCAQR